MQVWVWEYPTEDDDGNTQHHDLFMDPGEEIRFRVTDENFVDCSPNAPDPSKPASVDQVQKLSTIFQSVVNAKVSQQRFWPCHENELNAEVFDTIVSVSKIRYF